MVSLKLIFIEISYIIIISLKKKHDVNMIQNFIGERLIVCFWGKSSHKPTIGTIFKVH